MYSGSARVKAACGMLMKLTPDLIVIAFFTKFKALAKNKKLFFNKVHYQNV